MGGAPQPDNRRMRRSAAQELAKRIMQSGSPKQPLLQLAWSWPVVGGALFFVWGGAFAFMTSAHPIVADVFFLVGAALFVSKFLSWEDARQHEKRTLLACIVVISTLALMVAAIWGNHKLNATPQPEYHTTVDRHLTLGQADGFKVALERVNFVNNVKIGAPQNDGEAWDYAGDLETAFVNAEAKAGWRVEALYPVPPWDTSPGVTVLFSSVDQTGVSAQQIDLAFMEAQLALPKHGVDPKLKRGEIFVIVGRKD